MWGVPFPPLVSSWLSFYPGACFPIQPHHTLQLFAIQKRITHPLGTLLPGVNICMMEEALLWLLLYLTRLASILLGLCDTCVCI